MDVTADIQAKSDQLNAVDLPSDLTVIVTSVTRSADGRLTVHYANDNGRPWKPSKGMVRVLVAGWGKESDQWIGRSVTLFCEPSVKYGGKEVGGIHIRAMSDIKKSGINTTLAISRSVRVPFSVACIEIASCSDAEFQQSKTKILDSIAGGKITLEATVARFQAKGKPLTPDQIKELTNDLQRE